MKKRTLCFLLIWGSLFFALQLFAWHELGKNSYRAIFPFMVLGALLSAAITQHLSIAGIIRDDAERFTPRKESSPKALCNEEGKSIAAHIIEEMDAPSGINGYSLMNNLTIYHNSNGMHGDD